MWALNRSAACYDIWEKALYNTVLACMSRDGRSFFYVNPLTVDPAVIRGNPTMSHVLPARAKWFGVACCPPNMARTVLSIGRSIYALEAEALYVLAHIDSSLALDGFEAQLSHEGEKFSFAVDGPETEIRLRIPEGFVLRAEWGAEKDGYLCVRHPGGQAVYSYQLSAQLRVLRAHPRIAYNAGKVCLAWGQTVYCLEEADNGPALCELALPRGSVFEKVEMDWLPEGMCAWRTQGIRYSEVGWTGAYAEKLPQSEPATLTFIPYSEWNNRGEGEMSVWVNETV
ncbi:MAG: glycoside hydrolase family 127 protein, partial [Clostridia bacterium]|nr:glycoside hydrolase family 127 protein [Clostridia bacterium]